MRNIGLIVMALFVNSCTSAEKSGYYKGYELPVYSVIKSEGDIEIRDYQPALLAEVKAEGTREEAVKKGFRILAGYIFGANSVKETIAMTSPVAQKPVSEKISMTTPVFQVSAGNEWLVQFGMPKKYSLETLPKAKDERIVFRLSAPKQIVAIKFSGRWSDALFNENSSRLEKFIAENKLKPLSAPGFAYYDDPFTLPWNRRNEILIEVKK
jgi:hypothetical protein